MLNLLLKDLRVAAVFLWLIVPLYAVLALGSALNFQAHFWLTACTAFGLMLMVPAIQWYQGSDIFVSTLPVDRTQLVRARFANSGLVLAACLLAGAYPAFVFGVLRTLVGHGWPSWFTPLTGVEFVLVGVLVVSVSHPVLVRWGFGAAVVTGVASLLALAGTGLATRSGDDVLQKIDGASASPVGHLLRLMVVEVGPVPAVVAAALLAGGILALSLRLSVRWAGAQEF